MRNRKVAILITIIVMVPATLFGVGRSLNRLAVEVEAMFYNGLPINRGGIIQPQPGIDMLLGNIERDVLDVSSIFAGHPELSGEAEALAVARRELLDAGSISEKYTAYQEIQNAVAAFNNKAGIIELSERDEESTARFNRMVTGAMIAIEENEYNVRARDFMDGASYIAYMLRPFVFVTSPQTFDS